jgi:hypothetical protein
MKNKYVGDYNDYCKYMLISQINAAFNCKTLFVWMLTKDIDDLDGNKIKYLKDERNRVYNSEIFDLLKGIVSKREPNSFDISNIKTLENSTVFSGNTFINDILNDDKNVRQKYFEKVHQKMSGCELIFFDPDNGTEITTCKKGQKNSSKYIYWDELQEIGKNNKSILVYQHFRREDHIVFAEKIVKQFEKVLSNYTVITIETKYTMFVLATQKIPELNSFQSLLKEKYNDIFTIWKTK